MDRRTRRFVPRLEGSLEDRVVLTTGLAGHVHVSPFVSGTIPVLSHGTYESVVNQINMAFNAYRGQSVFTSVPNSLWNSLKSYRWSWPDGNKPNDINALRTRVATAASKLPFGAQQLVPTLNSEIGTTAVNKQVSHAMQNSVLASVRTYVQTGVKSQSFLLSNR